MASIAFSGYATVFLDVLVNKLTDFVIQQMKEGGFDLMKGGEEGQEGIVKFEELEDGISELEKSLLNVQAIVAKQAECGNTDRMWEMKVRAYMYDAKVISDIVITKIQKQNLDIPEVMELNQSLAKIRHKLDQLCLSSLPPRKSPKKSEFDASWRCETVSSKSYVVGRKDESATLSRWLNDRGVNAGGLNENLVDGRGNNFLVACVLGFTGIGKTTLARVVFNDPNIRCNFDHKIWISVNGPWNLNWVLRYLIEHIEGHSCSLLDSTELLRHKLHKLIKRRKTLIVLDGVWQADWDVLLPILQSEGIQGALLITTQSVEVARISRPDRILRLGPLPEDHCSSLLYEQALEGVKDVPGEFMNIGNEIAQRCSGLPLLVKTHGRVLKSMDMNLAAWQSVSQQNLLRLIDKNDELLLSFNIFYRYFPIHLKKYISFLSFLPIDYEFEKEEVIRMWMGEGLILSQRNNEDPGQVGSLHFHELLHRSCFVVVKDHEQRTERYRVSIFFQLLASYISAGEGTTLCAEEDFKGGEMFVRGVSLYTGDVEHLGKFKNASFIFMRHKGGIDVDLTSLRLNFVRVLCLKNCGIHTVPASICSLILLGYLDLSENPFPELPPHLGNLFNLQTLKLLDCRNLKSLPASMPNLVNLMYLQINMKDAFQTEFGVSSLRKLRLLSFYMLVPDRIDFLKDLFQLEDLCLMDMETLPSRESAERAILNDKRFIKKLNLTWSEREIGPVYSDSEVILGIQPHANLKDLTLRGYQGSDLPQWVLNMIELTLERCTNTLVLKNLMHCHRLKRLTISGMEGLVTIDGGTFVGTAFVELEVLILHSLNYLKSWSGIQARSFPRLSILSIDDCGKLTDLPELHHLTALTNLEFMRCQDLDSFPADGLPRGLQRLVIWRCPKLVAKCKLSSTNVAKFFKAVPHSEIRVSESELVTYF